MIYTVSSNPLYLPKNVWLCEAYVPKGTEPKYTAYSPSTKKWGEGHETPTSVKFTLDAPPFPVYTTECYSKQWVNLEDFYIDLDSKYIYHGEVQISWSIFTDYLNDCGIKLSILQLAVLFEKPALLKDKVYAWNAKIKASTPAAQQAVGLETVTYNTFYTQTTGAPVGPSDQVLVEQEQDSAQALENIYEEMKKQAFSFDALPKVKKPYINPYKWVLSGGKITYTPTKQVATDEKPEF